MNRDSRPAPAAYPGTQAVRRAVSLLKSFTAQEPERGLADLARAAGLNKTTAFRLLSALAGEGLVERTAEAYRLGPELLALGARVLGAGDLRTAARPELQALAEQTRETASVEVLVGRDVLILDEAMGRHVLGTVPSVGTRWPAHATSTGKVLLAHAPREVLDAFLQRSLPAPTLRTISAPSAFRRELRRVRGRGYAVTVEELEPGFVAVAAPIRAASGQVVAALSVGGPKLRLTTEQVARLGARLPAAALRVSERLGFRPPAAARESSRRKARR
jgi:DNA-binding IclR family transcriptional regulator